MFKAGAIGFDNDMRVNDRISRWSHGILRIVNDVIELEDYATGQDNGVVASSCVHCVVMTYSGTSTAMLL